MLFTAVNSNLVAAFNESDRYFFGKGFKTTVAGWNTAGAK
jgi:hypothetical protein